jgi:hypothetical protein
MESAIEVDPEEVQLVCHYLLLTFLKLNSPLSVVKEYVGSSSEPCDCIEVSER